MRCPGLDLDMCLVPRGVYDLISFAQDQRETISNIQNQTTLKLPHVNDFHTPEA